MSQSVHTKPSLWPNSPLSSCTGTIGHEYNYEKQRGRGSSLQLEVLKAKSQEMDVVETISFGAVTGTVGEEVVVGTAICKQAEAVPATSGKTILPKQRLSYRWVINDANTFLWDAADRLWSLRSPAFSTPSSSQWHLLIERKEVNVPYHVRRIREDFKILTSLSLCPNTQSRRLGRKLISNCTFSFLNPENNIAEYSTTEPSEEYVFHSSQQKGIEHVIEVNKIKECIFDDVLTIQVTANLLNITYPEEVEDHTCAVPMDKIRNEMHSLYKDKVLTDATLKCGGKEFKVHRAVLGSQSPVFKAMLQANMKEKQSSVIDISDITPAVMSDLVTYLYTGAAPNVGKLAKELLNAANKYGLSRLFTMCENELRMKIKVTNVVDTLLLADLHNATNLKKACLVFMREHSADVHKTSRWQYLKDNRGKYAALVLEVME